MAGAIGARMTNTQLAELILLRLYDIAEAESYGTLLELNEIAAEFGVTDPIKVINVARFLHGRHLIENRVSFNGIARASITGEGAILVERGGETGVIREYRRNPEDYRVFIDQSTHFHGSISGSNVAVHASHVHQELPQAESLLFDMEAAIRADTGLSERSREECLKDVATLRSELKRQQPRRAIVDALLSHLGELASITSLVMRFQQRLSKIPG